MEVRKEFVIPLNEKKLPLFAETMGYNPDQEAITRHDGYPYFHWLQSIDGTGAIYYEHDMVTLPPAHGVLFMPNVPHSYAKKSNERWETCYLTFDGPFVKELLADLNLYRTAFFTWDTTSPLTYFIEKALKQKETRLDAFNIKTSSLVYEFLVTMSRYAQLKENRPIKYERDLNDLITWMQHNISNSEAGLEDMASLLKLSKRHLNEVFYRTYHVTPYAFFISLRIKEAKKLLLNSDTRTIKTISNMTGFRSPSHFIATFRKITGVSPGRYRELH
ncbi:AraC family transcriptional regulator [Salipaludibacillus sp. LMS25]|jgi:AraC-like DNA-binding protein|uniref:helix-turn-helix transcriptional regulator n=1 Tax=Salipaludibacillus sp. LMS25 TaxID=2924031 RepID=UPI0020D16CDA|nr:AraC family transcriptional regulator [Salipaludibacillus sp. LMS25]UTR13588.1 AraC family transcriptional regulator [Salipaludibacillus sp. LMS25]